MADAPKLAAILGGAPAEPSMAGPEEAPENEQGREDQMQAFLDFTNEALPEAERMDALAFFIELVQGSGPTLFPDE